MEPAARTSIDDGLSIAVVGDSSPGSGALRVAMVCPYSLSRPGGVQGQAVGLTRVLAARGHRVLLFAPLDDAADAPDDVEFERSGGSIALPANGSRAPVSLSVPAVRRSLRAIRAFEPYLVHVHEPFTPGLPYGLLLGGPRWPLVATFHRSGPSRWYSALRPVTTRLASHLTVRCAVSDAARTTAQRALGGDYRVLFNGVEVDRYRSAQPWPTDRPAILFLGRHEARKGLGVLLEAFERLLARRPTGPDPDRPVLWVAGDGPLTEALRRRHPASADLQWLGVLPEAEKTRRLAGAAILCAPSLAGESFGVVLVEAMAAGTVVVASDIDGYRQAADDHAVLVPAGDPHALARAIEGVLSGELATVSTPGGAGRSRWLESASARADQWSMEHLATRYEDLYRLVAPAPLP